MLLKMLVKLDVLMVVFSMNGELFDRIVIFVLVVFRLVRILGIFG